MVALEPSVSVLPQQLPRTLVCIIRYFSVSNGLPDPNKYPHQEYKDTLPVRACHSSKILSHSALRVTYVTYRTSASCGISPNLRTNGMGYTYVNSSDAMVLYLSLISPRDDDDDDEEEEEESLAAVVVTVLFQLFRSFPIRLLAEIMDQYFLRPG